MAQSSDPYQPETLTAQPSVNYQSQSNTVAAVRQDIPAEPYSPFRVPPQRQLPELIVSVPEAGSDNQNENPQSARTTLFIALGVLATLFIGAVAIVAYFSVQNSNPLQGALTNRAQVGQCYTSAVRLADCGSPHTYEVFGTNQLPERSDYPGVLNRTLGSEACEFRFFDYVGVEYASSALLIHSIYPSESEWADGQRWEVCVLSNDAATPIVGSAVAS